MRESPRNSNEQIHAEAVKNDQGTRKRIEEALELVRLMHQEGVTLRLLGGVGVACSCGWLSTSRALRSVGDIDAVALTPDAPRMHMLLRDRGYLAEERFNALHGASRLIFHGPAGKLDIFIDDFRMCHRLPLKRRLHLDSPTVPPADLLLTKLQIVELNQKDALDAAALLGAHRLQAGPGGGIDSDYFATVLAADWGFWRTVTANLARVAELHPATSGEVDTILALLRTTPKTKRFKLRAVIGERSPWYDLPDELG